MDNLLFDLVAEKTPKFNYVLTEGLAVQHLQFVEGYVDRQWRTAEKDFPIELRYIDYKRCTPNEEYAEETRRLTNQSTYELARSDLYTVKYLFTYGGEELDPLYIKLPFVTDAGLIMLRGSTFSISPVLADKAISIDSNKIFIPLNRDKLTFERQIHPFMRNGEREVSYVIYSQIYHLTPKDKRIASKSPIRGKTTLVHYLLAKYGLDAMFGMYANVDVKVGMPAEINPETYNPDEWMICSSTMLKPPRDVRTKFYVASPIRLAIRKSDYNLTTAGLIAGFFYVVDRFPDRVLPEYVNETRLWRVLMGYLLWGGGMNEGKLADSVVDHLRSLDGYLDGEAKTYLQEDGILCEDLYGLFFEIIDTFTHRITQSNSQVASMYGKRLMILRYVMKDVTNAINKFMFKMNTSKKKPLLKQDVVKQMRKILKWDLIMSMNRDHGEVSSVSAPGDNKWHKITSALVLQADSSGGQGKSRATANDPSRHLHASIAEVGSFIAMGKSDPTGRGRANPYVQIAPDGLIIRDPDKIDLLDQIQRSIQR